HAVERLPKQRIAALDMHPLRFMSSPGSGTNAARKQRDDARLVRHLLLPGLARTSGKLGRFNATVRQVSGKEGPQPRHLLEPAIFIAGAQQDLFDFGWIDTLRSLEQQPHAMRMLAGVLVRPQLKPVMG